MRHGNASGWCRRLSRKPAQGYALETQIFLCMIMKIPVAGQEEVDEAAAPKPLAEYAPHPSAPALAELGDSQGLAPGSQSQSLEPQFKSTSLNALAGNWTIPYSELVGSKHRMPLERSCCLLCDGLGGIRETAMPMQAQGFRDFLDGPGAVMSP